MILNFVLNNSVTYRDRRLRGWGFWGGLVTFCLACGLGVAANVAIANEAFHRGVPWVLAALIGLLFTAVWNFGVTSMTTWRQAAAFERTARHGGASQRGADAVQSAQERREAAGEDDVSCKGAASSVLAPRCRILQRTHTERTE